MDNGAEYVDAVREPEYLRKIVRAVVPCSAHCNERGIGRVEIYIDRQAAFMLFYSTRHLFT